MIGIGPFIPHKDTPFAKEQGIEIDKDGFAAAMAEQKERARAARTKVSARIATPDTTKLKSESMTTEDTDGDTEILLLEVVPIG